MENKIFTRNHFFPLVGDILNTAYEYMYWEHENKKEYDDLSTYLISDKLEFFSKSVALTYQAKFALS